MSIHAYHAPTGADPEIYHQIHDAIRMLANAERNLNVLRLLTEQSAKLLPSSV